MTQREVSEAADVIAEEMLRQADIDHVDMYLARRAARRIIEAIDPRSALPAPQSGCDPEPWVYFDGTRRSLSPYPEGSENPFRVLWKYDPRVVPRISVTPSAHVDEYFARRRWLAAGGAAGCNGGVTS